MRGAVGYARAMRLEFCDAAGGITGSCHVRRVGRALVDRARELRACGGPVRAVAMAHTLGGLSAHGDQDDLLRWHANLRASGVAATVTHPGLVLDLAQAARGAAKEG